MNILVFVYKSIFKILCNKNLLTKRKEQIIIDIICIKM